MDLRWKRGGGKVMGGRGGRGCGRRETKGKERGWGGTGEPREQTRGQMGRGLADAELYLTTPICTLKSRVLPARSDGLLPEGCVAHVTLSIGCLIRRRLQQDGSLT